MKTLDCVNTLIRFLCNMKRTLLLILFFSFLFACKNGKDTLLMQSKALYKLPVDADIYFKIKVSAFTKYKNLHSFYRYKQLINYFKKSGITFNKNVEYIYGAYKLSHPEKSAFLIQGNFNPRKINNALKRSHKKMQGNGYVFYESKTPKKYSVSIKKNTKIIFADQDRMLTGAPNSRIIFHALNVLKRVNYHENTWILIYCTDSFSEKLKKWPILEILSLASFYSISIKSHSETRNIINVNIRIYIGDNTYTEEIVTTLINYFKKLRKTYTIFKRSFYNFNTYYKGNYAKISFNLDLASLKIKE